MRIAIIEDTKIHQEIIQELLSSTKWEVNYFEDAEDFGKSYLAQYDVIVTDNRLPTVSGYDLLKSISTKTNAQLFLMSAYEVDFLENSDKDFIAGFINKSDFKVLVDHLKYADAKIRINKCVEEDQYKFNKILQNEEFSLEIKNNVIVIGINDILSQESKNKITKEVREKNINGVIFFPSRELLPSVLLRELIYFYKIFKMQKKDLVFLNVIKSSFIVEQFIQCSLEKLFKIFDNLDDAMDFLKKSSS